MTGPSILVVDDDQPCREALVEFLGREGYRVRFARDGSEALDIVRSETVHCSVMDVHMPGLTGPEVLRRLLDERAPRVPPTVFVSSDHAAEQMVRELLGPDVGFLPKPVRLAALRQVIEQLLALGPNGPRSGPRPPTRQ